MRTPAEAAVENSICLEGKKDGLVQKQNGDWVLRLTLQAADMHPRLVAAAMGTIYEVALVEKADNGEPVDHVGIERSKWRDLGATKQAGMRCSDPVFWAWLEEVKHYVANNHDEAADAVRDLCGVTSRADLDKPGGQEARVKWHQLDEQFQAWRVKEAHGGG